MRFTRRGLGDYARSVVLKGQISRARSVVEDVRLALTWRGAGRLKFTLGIAVAIVVAAGLLIGIDGFRTRPAVDEARHENLALRAEQEALRNQAFDLAERSIEAVERGERIARLAGASRRDWESETPPLPARDARNEALLHWLSEQQAVLAALDGELASDQAAAGGVRAPVPTPVSAVTLPARDAMMYSTASMKSNRRKKASPPRR